MMIDVEYKNNNFSISPEDAKIRIIAQEVVREYTISVNDNIKELANNMQVQLKNFAEQITTKIDIQLHGISERFDHKIDKVVLKRESDIKDIRRENEAMRKELTSAILNVKDKSLTKEDLLSIYIKVTISLCGIGAAIFIAYILKVKGWS